MLRNLPECITPVSICGKAPDWYKGLQYKKLAPKFEFFQKWKQTKDNEYYIKCFQSQVLDELNPDTVISELKELAKSNNIALICYEKPGDFCHRHLVAEWLKNYGYQIEEYRKI